MNNSTSDIDAARRQHFELYPRFDKATWERLCDLARTFYKKHRDTYRQGELHPNERYLKLARLYDDAADWFYDQWKTAYKAWAVEDDKLYPPSCRFKNEECSDAW